MPKDDIKHPLSKDEATGLIHEVARAPGAARVFSGHARIRMRERQIYADWVDHVLREGVVDEVRHEHGSWRYRVAYTDQWGRTAVVTAVPSRERLIIVTVIRSE